MLHELEFIKTIESIAAILPAPLYWLDKNSAVLGCNEAALKAIGASCFEEVIGKSPYDFYPLEMAEKIVKHNEEVMLTNNTLAQQEVIKDLRTGEIRYYTAIKSPLRDKSGNIMGLIGSSIEITAEKKAELSKLKELRRINIIKHLEVISAYFPTPIYWNDLNSVILGVNEQALKAAGAHSSKEFIGKKIHDLYPKEMADKILEHNQKVIETGMMLSQEEVIQDISSGKIKYFNAFKAPLRDEEGKIIGTLGTSIETTAEKEAERLKFEAELQNIALQEKEKFAQLAQKVAHDIRSPIAALLMVLEYCDELPEQKRLALRNATRNIQDIANNLLNYYKKKEVIQNEERQPVLCSDVLLQLASEKRYQYASHPILFKTNIKENSWFAFIQVQASQLIRALSNLVNNAVQALESQKTGKIWIKLKVNKKTVFFMIEDNGHGMGSELVNKIQNGISFTIGKEEGHGLGLSQVRDLLKQNEGEMTIKSTVGKGTLFCLAFPRTSIPKWIVERVKIRSDDIILILDDDTAIHNAWDFRFQTLLETYPYLTIHHFQQGQSLLSFIKNLNQTDQEKLFLLSDYELLNQSKNGLEVIKESGVARALLVTSHYSHSKVQKAAAAQGIQLLPKEMASVVPIDIQTIQAVDSIAYNPTASYDEIKVVLLEDNQILGEELVRVLESEGINARHYLNCRTFMKEIDYYPKDIKIGLDNHFGSSDLDGFSLAKILHEKGYQYLYLISASDFEENEMPSYLTFISKLDLEEIKKALCSHG